MGAAQEREARRALLGQLHATSLLIAPNARVCDVACLVLMELALSCMQTLLRPQRDAPSMDELVDGAVSVLERVPASAHSLADLLTSASARDGRKHDAAIMGRLLTRLRGARLGAPSHRVLACWQTWVI